MNTNNNNIKSTYHIEYAFESAERGLVLPVFSFVEYHQSERQINKNKWHVINVFCLSFHLFIRSPNYIEGTPIQGPTNTTRVRNLPWLFRVLSSGRVLPVQH